MMVSLLQRVTLQKRQSNQSAFAPAYGPRCAQVSLTPASRRGGQIKSTARRGGPPAGLFGGLHSRSVVADEPCEAASGLVRHCDAAAVKPDIAVVQVNPGLRFYGRFATGRSLARLVSGYRSEPARERPSRVGSLPQGGLTGSRVSTGRRVPLGREFPCGKPRESHLPERCHRGRHGTARSRQWHGPWCRSSWPACPVAPRR